MSGDLVVDASIAVKWLVHESDSAIALQLTDAAVPLIAPSLVLVEIANALWKRTARGEISAETMDLALERTTRYFAALVAIDDLVEPAARIAHALGHPVYDCLYLALAARERTIVVTADRRFLRAVDRTAYADLVRPLDAWSP